MTVFTAQMDETEKYLSLHRIVSQARIFFYLLFGWRKWTGAWGIWHKQPNNRAAHINDLMYVELEKKKLDQQSHKRGLKNISGTLVIKMSSYNTPPNPLHFCLL